jgi:hypothetical protein
MMKLSACTLALAVAASTGDGCLAFAPSSTLNAASTSSSSTTSSRRLSRPLFASGGESESAFVAIAADVDDDDDDKTFDVVEKFGKGAAKVSPGEGCTFIVIDGTGGIYFFSHGSLDGDAMASSPWEMRGGGQSGYTMTKAMRRHSTSAI